MERKDIEERKDEILKWIGEHQPKAYMCRELKCKQETLNRWLKKMGIKYDGNMSRKGMSHKEGYIPASEYFSGEKFIKTNEMKLKLFKEGLKERRCELCGNIEWLGGAIPLELHHKDGNKFNNHFENLQILCPNCHAIQPNNSAKNIGAYTKH